jgi:hypothetical protein
VWARWTPLLDMHSDNHSAIFCFLSLPRRVQGLSCVGHSYPFGLLGQVPNYARLTAMGKPQCRAEGVEDLDALVGSESVWGRSYCNCCACIVLVVSPQQCTDVRACSPSCSDPPGQPSTKVIDCKCVGPPGPCDNTRNPGPNVVDCGGTPKCTGQNHVR